MDYRLHSIQSYRVLHCHCTYTPFGVKKHSNMSVEHENVAAAKCDIRLCHCLVTLKYECSKCGRACHQICYRGLVLDVKDNAPLPALPEGSICCTKKCYQAVIKDASSTQWADWKNNGKPETPTVTSIKFFWIGGRRIQITKFSVERTTRELRR